MKMRRRKVDVSKRSRSAGVCRKTLLLLAVVACPGLACKSAGATGQPLSSEPGQASLECGAELLLPQGALTYSLSCEGFTPTLQKVYPNAQVTFVSECDDKVVISFSNPQTLFTSGAESIVLEHRGDQKVETVSDQGGCHKMCFGSTTCPPDDLDSKTGSLDVYTSVPDPGASKPPSP
jgi:hypothetical protein